MVMGNSIILDYIRIERRNDNRRTFSEVLKMKWTPSLRDFCWYVYDCTQKADKDAGAWTRELPIDKP